jgi:hypothetical protein
MGAATGLMGEDEGDRNFEESRVAGKRARIKWLESLGNISIAVVKNEKEDGIERRRKKIGNEDAHQLA